MDTRNHSEMKKKKKTLIRMEKANGKTRRKKEKR
jgi:hypothetical protein